MLTPLITELERLYKGAEIDFISEGDIAEEVLATFFSVKNIYCLPKRGFKRPVRFLGLLRKVRKTHYDLIIDPCIDSGFSRALTRILNGKYKLGFSDEPNPSGLTHPAPESVAGRHMAMRPVNLLHWALGLEPLDADFPNLDIRLTNNELAQGRQAIRELLPDLPQTPTPPVVGIFANATGAKRYPMEWWSQFIDTFKALCPEAQLMELIPMHGHSLLGAQWPGYYSSDIRRMGAVMAGMDLMITADCGVMHLAVASRVPTIGLFCVTDATVYAPYGEGNGALATNGLSPQETAQRVAAAASNLLAPKPAACNSGAPIARYGAVVLEHPALIQ